MRTIRIPDDLVERLDAARGGVPRERFVRQLLIEALDGDELIRERERIADEITRKSGLEPTRLPSLKQTWRR